MEPRSHEGSEARKDKAMEPWRVGGMEPWRDRAMEPSWNGAVEGQRHRAVELWRHGVQKYTGAPLFQCTEVWNKLGKAKKGREGKKLNERKDILGSFHPGSKMANRET